MGSRSRLHCEDSNRAHKCRRTKQVKSKSSQERTALGSGLTCLDLPRDILDIVVHMIGVRHEADRDSVRDMACVARTRKKLRSYIEPYLYEKIITRIGTTLDTGGIVRLLHERPEIGPMISTLVLYDFDHRQTRCLLSIEFPRLRILLIQHKGDVR